MTKYRIHAWARWRGAGKEMSFEVELWVPDGQSVEQTFEAVYPHAEYAYHEEIV
jgi:hypothetical protein